ncbi:NdvB protein [Aliiglaciecola sp.]|nr:NdvB protein [Aliiglaciecola sp.]
MGFEASGHRYVLDSPTVMPNASGFLWNPSMLLQANCRGYITSQFMQPEPAKYASGPALEAKTFMQPEQPYYAHHPGRFFYIKDEQSGKLFSAPYEPVRASYTSFQFICEPNQLKWELVCQHIKVNLTLSLASNKPVECWEMTLTNLGRQEKTLNVYPYFPVGYRSWMNQSAYFDSELDAVVCKSITPYQKIEEYFAHQKLKDLTYLLAEKTPLAWETIQQNFEGEGGLHNPSALDLPALEYGQANYQTPAAIMQYRATLAKQQSLTYRFLFGPAKDANEIKAIRQQFFGSKASDGNFQNERQAYKDYISRGKGNLKIQTPDSTLNGFVNVWLPRQVFYHGDVNRLTTDPQTRNYLQDNMGLAYLDQNKCRKGFVVALSQQLISGEMPDGILLHENAQLKYINQIPHTDHCVWLPICLQAYLDESDDYELLDQIVGYQDSDRLSLVFEHIEKAMTWLENAVDNRGLSYINQGDWCDPMNMVGYKGKGVSGWLTLASAYSFKVWAQICAAVVSERESHWQEQADRFNQAANTHFWAQKWYARGITDGGRRFGVETDNEGKIFLNPQTWSILSGAADAEKIQSLMEHVEAYLMTPFGPTLLAPSYTDMVEDIGRVTQKFPGTAENGSVYNHAVCFYIFALYEQGFADRPLDLLVRMLATKNDMKTKGQLPTFIPNYYRGAYYQFPNEAGRSSQLFNTGTVAWYYRCILEGLMGLKGCRQGLNINPKLPKQWPSMQIARVFRGANIHMNVTRQTSCKNNEIWVNGEKLQDQCLRNPEAGKYYEIKVLIANG